MLDLKSIYLNFLSVRKITIKSFREIFFSTSFYNKHLQSEIPSRFFFYPNPYLLSPLLNHEDYLLRISKFEANYFWSNLKTENDKKNIHSFLWLNLIDRKNEKETIKKIIGDWIKKYGNYKKDIWNEDIVSKRIMTWISNADIFLDRKEDRFQKIFTESLIKQLNFLKKNINIVSYETTKISCLASIILSGLVFREYYSNYNFGLKELKKIIDNFFDKDGFPKNRNSEHLILFLQYFIIIKEWTQNAQETVPEFLSEIIEKNLTCLNSLKNESDNLPLFNGATEKNLKDFFSYLEKLNYSFEKKIKLVGEIQVLKAKKNILYFDTGEPPVYKYSKDYQSGPLSFEYFNDASKIITNCGYGRRISKKTKLISKFTSAQSTLCLNDTSVVRFQKSNLINKAYGSAISDTFKTFDVIRNENKTEYFLSATHNAYLSKYGYLHKREIRVLKKDGAIIGTDTLVKKKEFSESINFSIRFHIYPGINVVKTVSGRSILLQINKNKSWILLSDSHSFEIETGLFMGRKKVLNNSCVVIYGNTNNNDTNIKWELKKSV
tara:strand:- start:1060 stop:2709 length:1650 start_codon:yes stop_codon:yes gene_type:complete